MLPSDVKIGIIGDGVVGGALRAWFESQRVDVQSYDPAKGLSDRQAIERADVVFVCVPTPYSARRGFDDSFLLAAARGIGGAKLVVVKSTVLPGTTDQLQQKFSQHSWAFCPEFLREASAVEDMAHPDRQIVGCTAASRPYAQRLLALLPPAPFVEVCDAADAEMAKYVANSFLAVKVSFSNEVHDLCERIGVDYSRVRDIVAADPRIGGSHMDVFDAGYRGYGGKCLPKDSKSLLDLAESMHVAMEVLRAADAVNGALVAARDPATRREHVAVLPAGADGIEPQERAA